MYKLLISDDEDHTTVVPLLRDEVTIGRSEGNIIRLTERNVSRTHARLVKRNGSYMLEDLGSYNGIALNGERIDGEVELAAGDQLSIGDYDLAFQSDVLANANTLPSPKPMSHPPPRLVVLSELAAGAEFSLTKPALRIGRDERLDIWINHKSISHEHAEVQVNDGKVTVYDLESANGMRVNGVQISRAVLDAGDILELGEVRFRFLPPQGAHSLEPLPQDAIDNRSLSHSRKPLFVVSVLGILLTAGVGAVFVTMRAAPDVSVATGTTMTAVAAPRAGRIAAAEAVAVQEETAAPVEALRSSVPEQGELPEADSDGRLIEEPQEWEGQLARAREAMAGGHLDRAYAIADELPEDSILRSTPEFGEIRYRYAQSHVNAAERALELGDLEGARAEAGRVLGLEGITSKQRQDARRLMRRARKTELDPSAALVQAQACAARGDNSCVVRALEDERATSPEARALLIETYRAMDDFTAALQQMQTFVRRYPDDARASKYRQLLTGE